MKESRQGLTSILFLQKKLSANVNAVNEINLRICDSETVHLGKKHGKAFQTDVSC